MFLLEYVALDLGSCPSRNKANPQRKIKAAVPDMDRRKCATAEGEKWGTGGEVWELGRWGGRKVRQGEPELKNVTVRGRLGSR